MMELELTDFGSHVAWLEARAFGRLVRSWFGIDSPPVGRRNDDARASASSLKHTKALHVSRAIRKLSIWTINGHVGHLSLC
jgi:hypothetical protein